MIKGSRKLNGPQAKETWEKKNNTDVCDYIIILLKNRNKEKILKEPEKNHEEQGEG